MSQRRDFQVSMVHQALSLWCERGYRYQDVQSLAKLGEVVFLRRSSADCSGTLGGYVQPVHIQFHKREHLA